MKPGEAEKLGKILQAINDVTGNEATIDQWDDGGSECEVTVRVRLSVKEVPKP